MSSAYSVPVSYAPFSANSISSFPRECSSPLAGSEVETPAGRSGARSGPRVGSAARAEVEDPSPLALGGTLPALPSRRGGPPPRVGRGEGRRRRRPAGAR